VLTPENYPNGDIDQFINAQLGIATGQGNLLELRGVPNAPYLGGLSSSKRFDFLNVAFTTGITRQRGCTTVFIFSKHGMWEAHFWDIPAFEQVTRTDANSNILETQKSPPKFFDQWVPNFIAYGDGPGKSIF
jgi:hypothetical protein